MRPTIEVVYPDGRTETIELSQERSIVGRSSKAQIRISDNRVSREHCALELKGDRIFVIDLGGSNGTWIGASKLLANVPEPFPREEVVHVGPAQLRNVTAKESFDPDDDLESLAFSPVAPQRPQAQTPARSRTTAAAAVGGGGLSASEAALEPVQRRLTINPGERASVQFNVTNQGKIVDHYTMSIVGVPSTWVTLPTGGLELLLF